MVKAHFMNVRACYERARAKNPTLNGTVVLAWSVEPDGRVSRARVAESTMNSMEVLDNLRKRKAAEDLSI